MTRSSSRGASGEDFHWISEQFLDLYYLMPTNRCLRRFRPLSTRAIRALELRALNPADRSWAAFNYYMDGWMDGYIHNMYVCMNVYMNVCVYV